MRGAGWGHRLTAPTPTSSALCSPPASENCNVRVHFSFLDKIPYGAPPAGGWWVGAVKPYPTPQPHLAMERPSNQPLCMPCRPVHGIGQQSEHAAGALLRGTLSPKRLGTPKFTMETPLQPAMSHDPVIQLPWSRCIRAVSKHFPSCEASEPSRERLSRNPM
jgi:hypothetical protein